MWENAFEPGHEKTCLMSYANNKGADQPVHPRSLISVFVVRCLNSVMSLVSVTNISSLMLATVAEQSSLSLTSSETREDTFSHDEAHLNLQRKHFNGYSDTRPVQETFNLITSFIQDSVDWSPRITPEIRSKIRRKK